MGKKLILALIASITGIILITAIVQLLSVTAMSSKLEDVNQNGIYYPFDNTVFPRDFHSPTIRWKDNNEKVKYWVISIKNKDSEIFAWNSESKSFKIPRSQWDNIKEKYTEKPLTITVLGIVDNVPVSKSKINFTISKDEVGVPIFYRDVPLPFSYALRNLDKIKWRLGYVNSDSTAKVVMEKVPVCANCHSVSANGKVLAMDVDAHSGKDAYGIANIEKNTILYKIIRWSFFQNNQPTYGLLSSVSPDGRYFLSTLKDNEFFVVKPDTQYSQLFFPIRGIVTVYDQTKDKFWGLPGADDTNFVQSNPIWRCDGKEILFARAKAIPQKESGFLNAFDRDTVIYPKFIDDVHKGKRLFKYDLYRVPFNDGNGGTPEPVAGASDNNMSNYFPRYSPDGKWIIFTQANNFMLLQPDSKLYIIPAKGGTPRALNCNTPNMNSWHSWSPNGKWIVFASKMQGMYTQLYLTHIDENGMDSPPVFLEYMCSPNGAANLPEFVNIPPGGLESITPKFLEDDYYSFQNGIKKVEGGDLKGAIEDFDKAEKVDKDNFMVYGSRGFVKSELGMFNEAIDDFNKAISLKPSEPKLYNMRAFALMEIEKISEAMKDFNKAIELQPKDFESYNGRGVLLMKIGDIQNAVKNFDAAIAIKSDYIEAYYERGVAKLNLKDFTGAVADFTKVIHINANFAYAYYSRGIAKIELNQTDTACPDFYKAYKLGCKEAMQAIQEYCNKKK